MSLGQASSFGVFILGNFIGSGTDSQGPMAVGGNFAPSTGGFTVASQWSDPAGKYDLVVGGDLTNSGNTLGGGDIFVGGNMNWADPTAPHNVYVNGTFNDPGNAGSIGGKVYWYGGNTTGSTFSNQQLMSPTTGPVDFAAAQANLDSVSTALAGQTANGTVQFDGYYGYTLTGASSGTNVFNLSGVTADHVIFNFADATSLSLSSYAFKGTILAPQANFNGSGGQINGQLIAASAQGTTEFHNDIFSGDLPATATPELPNWAMMLSGVGMVVIARKKTASRRG